MAHVLPHPALRTRATVANPRPQLRASSLLGTVAGCLVALAITAGFADTLVVSSASTPVSTYEFSGPA